MACISNDSVAVTKGDSVELICTYTEKVDTSFIPDGVVYFESVLMWSLNTIGIQRVDLEKGKVITVVHDGNMPSYTYLTTNGKYFYHANCDTSVVTCSKMNGEKIWDFQDKSRIKSPYGITIDNDSNIYVASYGTNSIVVLSQDGKSEDEIHKQRGIFYDKSRNHLLVANEKRTVFLYGVS